MISVPFCFIAYELVGFVDSGPEERVVDSATLECVILHEGVALQVESAYSGDITLKCNSSSLGG